MVLSGALYRNATPTVFTTCATLPAEFPPLLGQGRYQGRHDLGHQIAVLSTGDIQMLATGGAGYTFDQVSWGA